MGSITSFNIKRNQQLKEEKKEKARRKARHGFLKETIKEINYCPFCGSVASSSAIRKDNAEKVYFCRACVPSDIKNTLWILSIEKF